MHACRCLQERGLCYAFVQRLGWRPQQLVRNRVGMAMFFFYFALLPVWRRCIYRSRTHPVAGVDAGSTKPRPERLWPALQGVTVPKNPEFPDAGPGPRWAALWL